MPITIPLTEKSWFRFAEDITKAGGKIRSRFIGVYAHKKPGRSWNWSAQAQSGGIVHYLGLFPFTKEGEEAAKKAYEAFRGLIPKSKPGNPNKHKTY